MSHQYFSNDFAKQFRSECEIYSPAEQYKHSMVLITRVGGVDAEMPVIGQVLTENILNEQLVYRLLSTLKNNNLPAAGRLFNEVAALKGQCEAYLQQEPYTGRFYNERIEMLLSFSELIDSFAKDFREQVYGQLVKYYAGLCEAVEGSPVAESTSLWEIVNLTDFYLKNMMSFYNYFIVAWQFEANNGKGIQLTTYMADHLQALVVNIEEMMTSVEETRSLLFEWEAKMELREEQELYN